MNSEDKSPKKDYNSREAILDYCISMAKKRIEDLNRDSSFVKPDTLTFDLLPEDENVKLSDGQIVGEPGRLEYMVECELECLNEKFRLDCEVFFDQNLTIDKFADILWEHKQKEGSEEDTLQSRFKDFFKEESEAEEDSEEDTVTDEVTSETEEEEDL